MSIRGTIRHAASARSFARAAAAREDNEEEEPVAAAGEPSQSTVLAPVAGEVVAMEALDDDAFASGALGQAVGVVPANAKTTVVAPADGKVISVAKTGHAYGIKTADGVELLVHIGICLLYTSPSPRD